MKIKHVIALISLFLMGNKVEAMVPAGTPLSSFPYKAASVLPITTWDTKTYWALLGQEANQRRQEEKDTYDDFGGRRDLSEKHPLQTASREAWEESVALLKGSIDNLEKYIDLDKGNTQDIVVSVDKKMVTYITNFNHNDLEYVTQNFYQKLKKPIDPKFKEKKALAWVEYNKLKDVIANAPRKPDGSLKLPITITANIVNPQDPSLKGQLKNRQITLRPVFVSKLQEYFKGSPYVEGQSPKIRFYKREYQPSGPAPSIPGKPVAPSTPSTPSSSKEYHYRYEYNYKEASVLPYTFLLSAPSSRYFLLSQDSQGKYRGTWSDFTGIKLGEKDTTITAARGAWNQSLRLLTSSEKGLQELIANDILKYIIITLNQQAATYMMNFFHPTLEYVANNFYSALSKTSDPLLKEKNALAWVKFEDLEDAMKQTKTNAKGELLTPIQVRGIIIAPGDSTSEPGPGGNYTQITLNPMFVSKLVEFFKKDLHVVPEYPTIKIYNGIELEPQIIAPKTKSTSLHALNLLSSNLTSLSAKNSGKQS